MIPIREQLVQLQKNTRKRNRIPTEEDSVLAQSNDATEHQIVRLPEEENECDFDESEDEENMQPVQFQRGITNRGKLCLWHQGFRLTFKHNIGGVQWFRCEQRSTCRAIAKLVDEQNLTGFLGTREHNHGQNISRRDAELRRELMKQKVKENPRLKSSNLRAEVRTGVDDEVFELLGTNEALDRMSHRVKGRMFGNVNRLDPLIIQIPNELLAKDGESVLQYDSRISRPDERDVVFLFTTDSLLNMLKSNRRWSLDGTFRTAPKPWSQVFIVGCFVHNRIVVAAQALLPGKNSKYYNEVLRQIRQKIEPVYPLKVMSDFESGMDKAMHNVFPECQRSGCNFHFAQALFRKAKKLGIFNLFAGEGEQNTTQKKDVYKTFRAVLSLALIPPQHVRRAFTHIINGAPPGLQAWLAYFSKNYIGTTQFENLRGADAFEPAADVGHIFMRCRSQTLNDSSRTSFTDMSSIQLSSAASTTNTSQTEQSNANFLQRWELAIVRPPKFSISFWNVYDRAQATLERTNNGMESSHKHFAKELNHHPSLSDFISSFVRDVDKQLDIGRAERLQKSRKRKQRYVIKEENIVRILDEADFNTDAGLMDAISLLGLMMQGFVEGLQVRREDEESGDETTDREE